MPTALVVDDADDIRLLLGHLLGSIGYEVVEASTGDEALALLGTRAVDIALVDVQMPDVDGWATLTAIRQARETADLPVILCTVKAAASDAARAWSLGCDGYLTKPFAIASLLAEVEAVAGRSPEQRIELRRIRLTELGRA